MGDCRYCGKSAGFLRKEHPECVRKREEGIDRIHALIGQAVHVPPDDEDALKSIQDKVQREATEAWLKPAALRDTVLRGIDHEVDRALDDNLLTPEEHEAIEAVIKQFRVTDAELKRRGTRERLVKAAVLRDLTEGIIPSRITVDGHLPFRFQKSETLLWLFQNVDYSTIKTRREFRGGSAGVSVRVAKGVYLRTGGFRGRPVETEEMVYVDSGLLGVTTRHVYFAGDQKSFRVRHDRIVTITPYSDGIGIMRDTARAKPEIFGLDDGWFAYNLLHNIEVG